MMQSLCDIFFRIRLITFNFTKKDRHVLDKLVSNKLIIDALTLDSLKFFKVCVFFPQLN